MGKLSKRFLSLLVAAVMVLSMLPASVFATSAYDVSSMTNEEVVDLCISLSAQGDQDALDAIATDLGSERVAEVEALYAELLAATPVAQAETTATVSAYKQVSYETDVVVDAKYFELIGTAADLEAAVSLISGTGAAGGLIEISEGTLVVDDRQDIIMANIIIKGAGKDLTTITGNSTTFNNTTNGLANKSNLSSEYKAILGLPSENIKVMNLTVDSGSCGHDFGLFKGGRADMKTVRINSGVSYLENVAINGSKGRTNLMIGTSSTTSVVYATNITVAKAYTVYGDTEIADGSSLTAVNSILGGTVVGSTENLGAGYYQLVYGGVTAYTTIPYAIECYNDGTFADMLAGVCTNEGIAEGTSVAQAMTADLTTILSGKATLLYGKDCAEMRALAAEFKTALASLSEDTSVDVTDCLTELTNALAINDWHNVDSTGICANCGKTGLEVPAVQVPSVDDLIGDSTTEAEKEAIQDVTVELKQSTALNDYTPTNLPENTTLSVKLTSMGVEGDTVLVPYKLTYDVSPVDSAGATIQPNGEVTFRLPIPASVIKTHAKVYHNGELMDTYPIQGTGNGKYVEVTTTSFSEFTVETVDAPVSEITTITSVADLQAFLASVNGGNTYEGKIVTLAADLDISGIEWTPIGNGTRASKTYTGNAFKGTFDGGNCTIAGLTITSTTGADAAVGLFGVLDGGTVKNLKLTDVNINVTSSDLVGGAIGLMVNGATADNITVSGAVTGHDGVGGIVGRMIISGTISNCTNNANVTSSYGGIGGIVGKAYYEDSANTALFASITGCTNNGTITAPMYVGGIVGLARANVTGCTNNGAVVGGTQTGGIVGQLIAAGTVSGNENKAKITGKNHMGGIIGDYTQSTVYTYYNVTIANNTNYGELAATEQCAAIMGCNNIDGFTDMTASGNVSYYYVDGLELFGNPEDMVIDDTNKFGSYVAQIGATYYESLQAAINAAQAGDTVTLLSNVTVTEKFTLEGVNLDLNDKTLYLKITGNYIIDTVTISNGTIDISDNAVDGNTFFTVGGLWAKAGSVLNLEEVNLVGDGYTTDWAVICAHNGTSLNITDSTVDLKNDNGTGGGFIKDTSGVDNTAIVTIKDSTITLADVDRGFTGAKVTLDTVTLTITGGEHGINGSELLIKDSTVSVSDGSGRGITLNKFDAQIVNSTVTLTNMGEGGIRFKTANALTVDADSALAATSAHADVAGATVNGYAVTGTEGDMSTVTVAGGTTTVANPYYEAMVGDEKYETLADAIAAAQADDTVTLLTDVTLTKTIKVSGKSFALNGNGNSISGNGALWLLSGTYAIENVVFSNVSTTGYGVLEFTYAQAAVTGCTFTGNTAPSCIAVGTNANSDDTSVVTIDGCTFTGNTCSTSIINSAEGTTSVKDSTITDNTAGIAVIYNSANFTATGNAFSGNTLTGDNANKAVILTGPWVAGDYAISITENAFVGDDYVAVYVEDWSEQYSANSTNNLNDNYWNGGEPAYSFSGEPNVTLDTYYTTYESGVLGGQTNMPVYVAQVGDEKYETLADAIAAAGVGDTITLLADVTLSETVVIDKKVTIEGEGKKIIAGYDVLIALRVNAGGDLTLGEGLTVEAANCAVFVRDGKLTTSANLTVTGELGAIQTNGSATADVTVNGGNLTAPDTTATIYWPSTGKLTINGGTITGGTAVYMKSGALEITGGKLVATGAKSDYVYDGNGCSATGAALVIENVGGSTGYEEITSVSITGGTFESANSAAVASYTAGNEGVEAKTGFISGGTFNTAVAEEYCAEGYVPVDNGDGTYGVEEKPEEKADKLTALSTSLKGNIGFKIYYSLTEETLADSGAYVIFKIDGEEIGRQLVSDAVGPDADGDYAFECEIAAAQMTKKVSIQMVYGDGTLGTEYKYSVRDYAVKRLNNPNAPESVKELLRAMLNYGAYAQILFEYNDGDLANVDIEGLPSMDNITVDSISQSNVHTGAATGIAIDGYSALLESETTFKFSFALETGASIEDYTFTYVNDEGKTVELEPKLDVDGCYCVYIEDIPAAYLDKMYTITVTNDNDNTSYSLESSVLCYAKSVLKNTKNTEAKINLAKALYLYSLAANTYFGE